MQYKMSLSYGFIVCHVFVMISLCLLHLQALRGLHPFGTLCVLIFSSRDTTLHCTYFTECPVGVYAVAKVRGELTDTKPGASDMMTNFREIHSEGELSDEEFRKIKTSLADRLEDELNDSGEEG